MTNITEDIYNKNASNWERREPNSLSDFTGRPVVFNLCGDVSGLRILDIGCGEGYCARILKAMGAASIEGIDISPEMIALARSQTEDDSLQFQVGDVQSLSFENDQFDLVVGVFVYNYLTVEEMERSHREVFRVLKPGGRFLFSVPHPAFPQIKSDLTRPFYFDFGGKGYFSSRDIRNHGVIFCRDGKELPVQMIHKLFEDYFSSLAAAGFTTLPSVTEMGVKPEHMELDAEFFSPVNDIPLHMAISLKK